MTDGMHPSAVMTVTSLSAWNQAVALPSLLIRGAS